MAQEIIKGIYRIKVPLPGNPLKALNSYLIKGDKRSLLVDTGFNWPECKAAQLEAMADLGVDWADVDFFITHIHGDHSGLVYELATPDSAIYCSEIDVELMRKYMKGTSYLDKQDAYYVKNGFPEKDIEKHGDFTADWIAGIRDDFTYVQDGDILEVGDYHLTCIATPGHSPGHMCLYEPDHKFLIAGDHILATITSNITSWNVGNDDLGLYLSSLDKVNDLDIDMVLPGHREMVRNSHKRIAELKNHHAVRLDEIMDILKQGPMNAYQVAGKMHWQIRGAGSWEEVSSYQRWFATGEAMAHLEHLAELNEIEATEQGARIVYELAQSVACALK